MDKRGKSEKRKRKKRSKTKKKFQEIYQNRLNQVAFNKGERGYELIWENTPIGVYDLSGIPPNLDKIRHDDIKWKHIDKVVRFNTPIRNLKLKEDFLNTYGCGEYQLPRGNLILHVNTEHKGIVQASSHINQTPWIDGIIYYDPKIELLYCRPKSGLPKSLNKYLIN